MSGFFLFVSSNPSLQHSASSVQFLTLVQSPLGDIQPYLVQWALLRLISEDNHCTSLLVCSYPINSYFLSISESRSGLVIVSPSQPDNKGFGALEGHGEAMGAAHVADGVVEQVWS